MIPNLIFRSIITLLILNISNPLETKAEHRNSLIKNLCIASIKSKIDTIDKTKATEISHSTCECFLNKLNAGNSIRGSRIYCKNKSIEKYNL